MSQYIEDEVAYYYDFHPTEEDLMGETTLHAALINYLAAVLRKLFEGQACAVYTNLNFYQTPDPKEYPLVPDIAIVKGENYRKNVRSWRVGKTGPAPHVVFEIASEETWDKDLSKKPTLYAQMGVQEYIAYDPHEPPLRRRDARRLFGWHLAEGIAYPLPSEANGRLWSPHLDSFLIPDADMLHLTDRQGLLRLTKEEAANRKAEIEAHRATIEAHRAEIEARRAKAEAEARKEADRRAEAADRRAEAEARRAEIEAEARKAADRRAEAETEARKATDQHNKMMKEKLRSLGIDPDQI